jgi:hypothetical protein
MRSGLHDKWFRGSDHYGAIRGPFRHWLHMVFCLCLRAWNTMKARMRDCSVHDSLHQDVKQRPRRLLCNLNICSFSALRHFFSTTSNFISVEKHELKQPPNAKKRLSSQVFGPDIFSRFAFTSCKHTFVSKLLF